MIIYLCFSKSIISNSVLFSTTTFYSTVGSKQLDFPYLFFFVDLMCMPRELRTIEIRTGNELSKNGKFLKPTSLSHQKWYSNKIVLREEEEQLTYPKNI